MLADKSLRSVLDAFSAPTPTPGGGSAAALAGATAAALLTMVAAMPKTKHGTPEDRTALDAAHLALAVLRVQLTDLIDRDAAAYDLVVGAYRLPKATDEDKAARKAAIGRAMRTATDVPLETVRGAAAVVRHGLTVAAHGNPSAASDVAVAALLARAALESAVMNVEVNLDGVGDEAYSARVREELRALRAH